MDVQLELLQHLELQLVVYCLLWKRLHLGKDFYFLIKDSVCIEACAVKIVVSVLLVFVYCFCT